jgi:hypothetical protein
MIRAMVLAVGLVMPFAAQAQEVGECDWRASAAALGEPWEENSRTFASGAVRLALLDTVEPAAGALHMLVLSPPYDELGTRQCRVVSHQGGIGFAGLEFDMLEASYDAAIGLIFQVPVTTMVPEDGSFAAGILTFTLNQATGDIFAELAPNPE